MCETDNFIDNDASNESERVCSSQKWSPNVLDKKLDVNPDMGHYSQGQLCKHKLEKICRIKIMWSK